MANQLFSGSINVTKLVDELKKKHSSFTKGKNGSFYANILIWQNEEPDQYGNHLSLQLNSTKEKKDSEEKVYIGNGKKIEKQEPTPVSDNDVKNFPDLGDDLPF
jgi:hypothetical protein